MKIASIRYPDTCQVHGWSKMVLERRLKHMLGSFFSVCDLDRCRADILGRGPDEELLGELRVFHCVSFKDMSVAESQALVDKTAQYVGAEITMKRVNRIPAVIAAVIGGLAVGAAGACLIPTAVASKNIKTSLPADYLGNIPRSMPELSGPRLSESSPPPEPVFTTTIRSDRPGVAARTLARAVRDDAGEYEVSLTVTPVTKPDER